MVVWYFLPRGQLERHFWVQGRKRSQWRFCVKEKISVGCPILYPGYPYCDIHPGDSTFANTEGHFKEDSSFENGTNDSFAFPPRLLCLRSLFPFVSADVSTVCHVLFFHWVCRVFCVRMFPFHMIINLSCFSLHLFLLPTFIGRRAKAGSKLTSLCRWSNFFLSAWKTIFC